jgi:hypothetical protein
VAKRLVWPGAIPERHGIQIDPSGERQGRLDKAGDPRVRRERHRWRFPNSFTNTAGDGAYPYGNLVLDSAGNLYGTTEGGNGIVFEVQP